MPDLTFLPVHTQFAAQHAAAIRDSYTDICQWQPWPKADQSPDDSSQWIAARMLDWESGAAYEFLVFEDEQLVGGGGLNQIQSHNRIANLGYWTHSRAVGRGIATALIRHHVAWARENTDLHRIEIVAEVTHVASWRAAEKAGAQFEGIARGRLNMRGQFNDARVYSFVP